MATLNNMTDRIGLQKMPNNYDSGNDQQHQDNIEKWLNNNPQFFEDYFMKYASSELVDRWLAKRTKRVTLEDRREDSHDSNAITDTTSLDDDDDDDNDDTESITTSDDSRSDAGEHDTISSNVDCNWQKFVRYQRQKFHSQESFPIQIDSSVMASTGPRKQYLRKSKSFTTYDGNLPSTARAELLQSVLKSKVTLPLYDNDNGEWKSHLNSQNQQEIFLALVRDISNELDLDRLCGKISLNVSMLTKVERCLLYLIEGTGKVRELVCKSLYVDPQYTHSTSTTTGYDQQQLDRPWGQGLVGLVCQLGEVVKIDDGIKVSYLFFFFVR